MNDGEERQIDELATLIGKMVLGIGAMYLFFFFLYTFYYIFILAGGGFCAWIFWNISREEGKDLFDSTISASFAFIVGAVAVTVLIAMFYGSKAPWH